MRIDGANRRAREFIRHKGRDRMKVVLQNLTKKFPGRGKNAQQEVVAVDDFTFEIPDGKLVGLLGPSGCGKSTTLNLLCGLLKPTSGKIYFGEDDVTALPAEKRGVGLVFQNYALSTPDGAAEHTLSAAEPARQGAPLQGRNAAPRQGGR